MKADVYWIREVPVGRLAIMPRPRAGDWLVGEIKAWRNEGVSVIVSLLTPFEVIELGLQDEIRVCEANNIKFISFPIHDRQVPRSVQMTGQLVERIQAWLAEGHGVAIHCRMGVGRSALIAACVLQKQGFGTAQAFAMIAKARGIEVPDTDEQRRWAAGIVRNFAVLLSPRM
ncbi:MAG: dual specificity protein phosphatase family protein [Chloroflexota bacterium]